MNHSIIPSLPKVESSMKWEVLAQASLDLICILDADGSFTFISEVSLSMLGYKPIELVGRHYSHFVSVEDLLLMQDAFKALRNGVNQSKFENRLFHKKGDVVPVLWSVVWSEEEEIYYCVVRNIASGDQNYNSILKQTDKLDSLVKSITDAFLMVDRSWQITYINSEVEKLTGLNKHSDIDRCLWEIFPEETEGDFYCNFNRALVSGAPEHFTTYLQDRGIWLKVKAYPSAEGLSVYFEDITEQVQSRRELEKLSLVASKTNNSVVITDKGWHIEWVNDGFLRLFGYTYDEVIGKRPSGLLHGPKTDKSAYENIWNRLLGGEVITFEIMNVKKNGEEVWLSIDITPVVNEKNEIVRFISVQTDITKLKNSELDLAQLAQDLYRQKSDLQEFTYIISHNLRGPVANLLGLANLLLDTKTASNQFAKSLPFLRQSVTKLDDVLLDLNTLLSIRDSKGYLEMEQVEVQSCFEQALSSFKDPLHLAGAQVHLDKVQGSFIKGSKAYLHSIFYNLISNAIKYKANCRALEIYLSCSQNTETGETLISFSDNGSGFDSEKAKNSLFKLYKRFHKVQEGRGIGLFLIKSHVDAMNGKVEVTSQIDAGTTFLISLPTSN